MDLDKLLENRGTLLFWDTPYFGWGKTGRPKTINIQSSVTVQNAIDMRKWQLYIQTKDFARPDKEILHDFIIVYGAYTKQEEI